MVKQGPLPAFVHGLYEYVLGAALIVVPLLIGYVSGAATATSIILGVLVIVLTATTCSSTSLVNQVPLNAHIILDYVLAAILIASPFLFGFSDEDEPTAVFIGGGVLHLLISIATRYRRDKEPKRGTPKREQRAIDSGGSADDERPSRGPEGIRDDEIPEFEPPPRPR